MTFPGPAALGRGLVVTAEAALPAAVNDAAAGWDRVRLEPTLFEGDFAETGSPLFAVVEQLHRAWATRRPTVIELRLAANTLEWLRRPAVVEEPPHRLGPEFTLLTERLHFLLWRNNYDARSGTPIWWWARKAARLGATVGGRADVVLADGPEVWIDGGPRQPLEQLPVVHAETVELGRLRLQPRPRGASGDGTRLAPDQRAAVENPSGPVRVVAPAGSGKTRTLNARLLHLVDDRGVEGRLITAVAYNNRAAAEMRERLQRPDLQIRTIHSLGWAILREARPAAQLLGERDVRRRLQRIVPHTRRAGSDVLAPYIEALADVRIALVPPEVVEAERGDVGGFAGIFESYRSALADADECDFDEQVYEAIRLVLADPVLRGRWQERCRHLLVDEFQDLTPAYLLLLRLLATPELNVFGVGDDDQTIYGYAGADPRFLLDYERFFPGAAGAALEVSYRCLPEVVEATGHLLVHNLRRLPKIVRAAGATTRDSNGQAPGAADTADRPASAPARRFRILRLADEDVATAAASVVAEWRAEGVAAADIAVLARVNSMLLPPLAALDDAGVATRCALDTNLMYRTLVRATLAWVRLALRPSAMAAADLTDAVRRPSRRINRLADERLQGRRPMSLEKLAALGGDLDDRQDEAWSGFVADIDSAARVAAGGDSRTLIDFLVQEVGLGRAAGTLDSGRTRPDRAAHAHDLVALRRAAAIYRDPATLQERLWDLLRRSSEDGDGVALTTIHRVKGLEWDRVLVFGAEEGLLPHRLCSDVEEERRVLHVAVTRGRDEVVVLADSAHPSRFLDELEGRRPPPQPAGAAAGAGASRRPGAADIFGGDGRAGAGGADGRGSSRRDRAGAADGEAPYDEALFESLRLWRLEEARRADLRAFHVFTNRVLRNIARHRPTSAPALAAVSGVGPAKMAKYGAAVIAIVRAHLAGASDPAPVDPPARVGQAAHGSAPGPAGGPGRRHG